MKLIEIRTIYLSHIPDVIKSRLQAQVLYPTAPARLSTQSPSFHFGSSITTFQPLNPAPSSTVSKAYHGATAMPLSAEIVRPYTGIIDCAVRSYQAEGLRVFTRGIVPTIVRAFPVNSVTFFVYEAIMEMLRVVEKQQLTKQNK